MNVLLFIFVLVASVPLYSILAENYKFESNCVPACTASSAPLTDMKPCMCRPNFFPAGCQIPPCGPGEVANENFTCQCTDHFRQDECVTLSCDNGTNSYGSSCALSSYSSSCYPSPNYPTSKYPTSNYPTSNYLTSKYPTSKYPSQNYPTSNYPSLQYGYPQPSYNPYPSSYLCNKYCVCEPYLPADCTANSTAPIVGGPACACISGSFKTGCTIRSCRSAVDKYCDCTPTFQPPTCFTPRCSSS